MTVLFLRVIALYCCFLIYLGKKTRKWWNFILGLCQMSDLMNFGLSSPNPLFLYPYHYPLFYTGRWVSLPSDLTWFFSSFSEYLIYLQFHCNLSKSWSTPTTVDFWYQLAQLTKPEKLGENLFQKPSILLLASNIGTFSGLRWPKCGYDTEKMI